MEYWNIKMFTDIIGMCPKFEFKIFVQNKCAHVFFRFFCYGINY